MEGPTTPEVSTDSVIENLIHNGEFVAEGKDGVVMKVKINNIDERILDENHDSTISPENYALKILKIYKAGEGRKEYGIQMRAYNLLSSDPDKFAQVPKPLIIHTQHLNETDRNYINNLGASLGENAEVIIMDFIEGVDLAVYIYDFILTRHGNFDQVTLKNMSFVEKQNHVAGFLNFEFPKNVENFQVAITNRDNLKKLVANLQKSNFHIDKEFIDKISTSVEELENNRIFHNDLHERNIIVGNDGKPYIIDFGRAVLDKNEQESDDKALPRRLKEITISKETLISTEDEAEIRKWQIYLNKRDTLKLGEKFKTLLDANSIGILTNYLRASLTQEAELDKNLAILVALINKNPKLKQKRTTATLSVIDQLISDSLRPFDKIKLKKFRKFIESM